MSWWLKRVYWSEQREDASSWLRWTKITDPPGRKSKWWKSERQPHKGDVYPRRGPHYTQGDLIVICVVQGRGSPDNLVRCPAIYEVRGEPHWDPDLADSERETTRWGTDGDKGGVLTPVTCIHAVNTRTAPYAESFGFELMPGNQAVFMTLDDAFGEQAKRMLEAGEGRTPPRRRTRSNTGKPALTRVPIEERDVEGYDVRTKAESSKAQRAEHRLARILQ